MYSPTYSILSHDSTTEVHLVSQTKIMRCYCIHAMLQSSCSIFPALLEDLLHSFSCSAIKPECHIHFTIMIVCRYLVKTCREAGITLNCAPNPNLGHLLAFLCQLLNPTSHHLEKCLPCRTTHLYHCIVKWPKTRNEAG